MSSTQQPCGVYEKTPECAEPKYEEPEDDKLYNIEKYRAHIAVLHGFRDGIHASQHKLKTALKTCLSDLATPPESRTQRTTVEIYWLLTAAKNAEDEVAKMEAPGSLPNVYLRLLGTAVQIVETAIAALE